MAIYRQVHTAFWQDDFVLELTPEEKFFYVYLMTNGRTTQCGIFKFPRIIVQDETGYNRETIDKLVKRFEEYKKIKYSSETNEIIILNWIKYNFINSKSTFACINKELKAVKNKAFVALFYDICRENECYDEVMFRDISYIVTPENEDKEEDKVSLPGVEGVLTPQGEEKKIKEDNIKEDNIYNAAAEIENEPDEDIKDVISVFNNNMHLVSQMELQQLIGWAEEFNAAIVILAIEEAVQHNAKNMKYINQVLNNWLSLGLKTEKEVKKHIENWGKKQKKYEPEDDNRPNAAAYKIVDY